MNKQFKDSNKDTINAKEIKVSVDDQSMHSEKTFHVSESDVAHKAYILNCENYNDIPLKLSGAKYKNTNILSARVVENSDQLDAFVSAGNFNVEEITIPAGADRDAFLKKWFKIATKKKANLLPLLLLPLTACGGADDATAPIVSVRPPAVDQITPGVWKVSTSHGEVTVTNNTDNTKFVFTPTTGSTVEVAISGFSQLQIPAYVVVNADASVISGKTINGAGTINVTNL